MKTPLNYKNIKKIGLVSRQNSNLDEEILFLKDIFEQKNIELLLEKTSSKTINLAKFELEELFVQSDFVISLGGDGTLISLCRKACEYNKALLGINAGNLGFLTDFKTSEARAFFDDFFEGKFRIEKPFLLEVNFILKDGQSLSKTAFNDVVFFRNSQKSMAHIEVLRNSSVFNEYSGDGLVIASPAGSTAYNLSANGPIVYTLAEVFILTPVCSHSLTQRPVVLPRGFELEVRTKDCLICIDGQENFKSGDFESIKIKLSDKSVSLIHPQNRDYFQILKEKLHWGK
ncbi:NAD(+) kinase [Campylobacter sp. MIT 99-7217]|uniref:NAD(+) kinase n=1 Tax=Campylobacter sp. MIT 99-7217 TaxID=535091 RepID=UPI001157719D|nr:NAD(+) kinase [Campylobacter sp. MIT 99-7217]TQR31897.1 NAD(+) kinase [Campylobacter sp. MIT 99-7217]